MRRYTLVFAGGFCGTLARYVLSAPLLALAGLLPQQSSPPIPVDILLINLSGTLALGFLYGLVEHGAPISHDLRLAIGTGFLGAYTTFSSLTYGGDTLLAQGKALPALIYLGGSIALGVLCAHAGIALAGIVQTRRVTIAERLAFAQAEVEQWEIPGTPDDLPVGVRAWGEGD